MKVAVVGKFLPPQGSTSGRMGGVEEVVKKSAECLAQVHQVIILVSSETSKGSTEQMGKCELHRLPTQAIISSQPINFSLARALKRINPDVIHFHAPNFWAALCIQVFCPTVPVIVTHHADVHGRPLLRDILRPIYRRLARRAVKVIVLSLKNATSSRDLPRNVEAVAIPHGLDPARYETTEIVLKEAEALRRSLGETDFVISFVGRLVRYKGLDVLIAAIARVPGAHLLIAGNGPLLEILRGKAVKCGVQNRVHFLGRVSEQEKLVVLAASDVFALPSTEVTEAFGIAQVEAQFCGLPVVASNLPTGVTDVTLDNVTGLLVIPGDAADLAEKLMKIRAHHDMRARFARAGRERAHANFTRAVSDAALLKVFAALNVSGMLH